ncbi:MAG TPA: PqqD family protein [Blastocatellia bacterium]|nr:PqqD family protein [Blastocatellia bacterium]
MTDATPEISPRARRDGLVIRAMPEEVLVYDIYRHRAHCLNGPAAMVWNHCDGETTVAEMAGLLEEELKGPVDEAVVRYALGELEKARLLEGAGARQSQRPKMTRREVVRRVGLAAAAGLPLVTSILAPAATEAATCRASGAMCVTSAQCCSGLCSSGRCV